MVLERLVYDALVLAGNIQLGLGGVSDALAEVLEFLGSDVGCKDEDGVAEIDVPSVAVCQPAFVKYLEKEVEYVRMGFFYLVEQNHAVRLAAYFL